MSVLQVTRHAIDLALGHSNPHCREMADKLHAQLSNGYTHAVSAMELDRDFDEYLATHRTARKRAAHARRLGYEFGEIERSEWEDDIFAINTSTPERQGRPMSPSYLEPHHFAPNPLICESHHVYAYGVLEPVERHGIIDRRLVAYLWLYRSGDLAMVSSILGHADRLADDVMFLLVTETIRAQIELGGTLFYNLHSSGTDGLRAFKERLGLIPTEVSWRR